jgi:two-component system, sensor histidine kinase and response regulator
MDEQVRIFDKFYRIPRNDAWSRGGTGLGLALVKRVVLERLGGEITVFSQQGWTTFQLKLPVNFTL